jgi:RNA polymerase sigma-70 factor (ECF subfamily)
MHDRRVGTDALEAHVREDHDRVIRIVAVACGSSAVAEDAVQEAWRRAWVRTASGEPISNIAGWIVVVATNLARSEGRRRSREQRAIGNIAAQLSNAVDGPSGELVDLRAAISGLRLRQRQVVVLHYLLGLDVKQIAALLHVSEGNVKNALFRARATLSKSLRISEETP